MTATKPVQIHGLARTKYSIRDKASGHYLSKDQSRYWLSENEGASWVKRAVALKTLKEYAYQKAYDPKCLQADVELVEITVMTTEKPVAVDFSREQRLGTVLAKAKALRVAKSETESEKRRRTLQRSPFENHRTFLNDVEVGGFLYDYSMILNRVYDPPEFKADYRLASNTGRMHLAFKHEKDLIMFRMYYAGKIDWMFDFVGNMVWKP